jgi:hypothetical protein
MENNRIKGGKRKREGTRSNAGANFFIFAP